MTTSAQTRRERNRLRVLLALSLAAFIISLNVTIVNVALPTLVRTLGATTTQLQWMVDAYSLVFAAFAIGLLVAGQLPRGELKPNRPRTASLSCLHKERPDDFRPG
jgi:predicted MFS family arabinose efflux permease